MRRKDPLANSSDNIGPRSQRHCAAHLKRAKPQNHRKAEIMLMVEVMTNHNNVRSCVGGMRRSTASAVCPAEECFVQATRMLEYTEQ
jgi:hypothetical protein